MKAVSQVLLRPQAATPSNAAPLLELAFSAVMIFGPLTTIFFPPLQPARQQGGLHAGTGLASTLRTDCPLDKHQRCGPALAAAAQSEAVGLADAATAPWTCVEQREAGLLFSTYPCGGSYVEQIQHVLRWPSFYLVSRPITLSDWLCVTWVLAHTLIISFNALLLVAKSAGFGVLGWPATAAATAGSEPATVLTRCDPRVTQLTQARKGQSDISNSSGELRVSSGISRLARTVCSCSGYRPSSPPIAPAVVSLEHRPAATALSSAAAAPSCTTATIFTFAVRSLLKAWSHLREPLLVVASPSKCGFASLVYLCGWLVARGMGVDERRRRWVLLSAHNNGMAAARHPHVVALLIVLSAICQRVRPAMMVRACLASMLSCLALSIASAAVGLPPWDGCDLTSPHPPPPKGLSLALAVARERLPAYAAAYLTPLLYLYICRRVHDVYGNWSGVRWALMQRSVRGVRLQLPLRRWPFDALTVSGMRGEEEHTDGNKAALSPSQPCGAGASSSFSADPGSKKPSVLRVATQESGGALTASGASVQADSGGASSTPPSSSATLRLASRTDTLDLAASASWHDSHSGRSSGSCSARRPSPSAPSPLLPFELPPRSSSSTPDAAALAPSDLSPGATCGPAAAQRSGPAAASAGLALTPSPGSFPAKGGATRNVGTDIARCAAAAADAAAALGSPSGSTAVTAACLAGSTAVTAACLAGTTAPGAAAERPISGIGRGGLLGAGRAPPDPLYSSRLPSSTLVMSCKFRTPPSMSYAVAAGALRTVANRRVREAATAARAAAAAAGEVPEAAGSALHVQCLTLPGCVQLVLVVEGADEVAGWGAAADAGEEGVWGGGSGAAVAVGETAVLPLLDQLPSWLQPRALWAAVARAAEGLGMRPLTAPQLQAAAHEPASRAGEEQQQPCVLEPECGLDVQAVVEPRAPALMYLEPPVLSTTTLHSSELVRSQEQEHRGGSCRAWAWEQAALAGGRAASDTDPAIAVDLHIPPDVLQNLNAPRQGHQRQQEEQQQGALDATLLAGAGQWTGEGPWQLVVVATSAASDDLEAPPSPVLLHSVAAVPPAAGVAQHTLPTSSPLDTRLPPPADPPALAGAQELNTNGHAAPYTLSLRLQLFPSTLRRLGVLPAADTPPSPFFSTRRTRPTPTPTPYPFPRAFSCPSGSHAATTAPPAPPCTPRALAAAPELHNTTTTAGESCSSTSAATLLHLHLLAVPKGAPLHLESDKDQPLFPLPRRHVSGALSPSHVAYASQRRRSSPAAYPGPVDSESVAHGYSMDCGLQQGQQQGQQQRDRDCSGVWGAAGGQHGATSSGASGRGPGATPWGRRVSWSTGVTGSVAAASSVAVASQSAPTALGHPLPQAVWLGSAPLLLAPPGPAEELAALWERMKEAVEGQGQGEGQEGTWVSGAAGRYVASSGVAMQHHMRPLLRDLAAAVVGCQGQALGVDPEDTAHLRAFLQSQGMSSCVEWIGGEGGGGSSSGPSCRVADVATVAGRDTAAHRVRSWSSCSAVPRGSPLWDATLSRGSFQCGASSRQHGTGADGVLVALTPKPRRSSGPSWLV